MTGTVVIGLSAVVAAVADGACLALTVSGAEGAMPALPFGPFAPETDRTFELALRAFVTAQTGFDLGYVEQLYTFGDEGRDAPLADLGLLNAEPDPSVQPRIISVGYLALTPETREGGLPPGAAWTPFTRFFPWEEWRAGRPAMIDDAIAPRLMAWAAGRPMRLTRVETLFALNGARWNEERVLDRYELLYEAGLAAEAARDRGGGAEAEPDALGQAMASDHRRILATALGRLRGKLKYRPVVFDLVPGAFTLLDLQRTVEAVSGVPLHKPNFRRMVERTDLVEPTGRFRVETGGRPAELFTFRRDIAAARPAIGLSLPVAL